MRAEMLTPLLFSSPISTPQTSVLPSRWGQLDLVSQNRALISGHQVRLFLVRRSHCKHVKQRKTEVVDRAFAKTFRAVVAMNRFHHAHLPVARAGPLLITNASDWREKLFLCSAFRTFKFVHDVPAELHHDVLRSQIHC